MVKGTTSEMTDKTRVSCFSAGIIGCGEKEKKLPRKPKVAVNFTESPPLQQENNERTEMRTMFREMKSLTECNSVYIEMLANAEQAKLDWGSKHVPFGEVGEGGLAEDHPDIDNLCHEQVTADELAEVQSFEDLPRFADPPKNMIGK